MKNNKSQFNMLNYCADSFYYIFALQEKLTKEEAEERIDKRMRSLIEGTPIGAILLNTNYNVSMIPSKTYDMAWCKHNGDVISDDIKHWNCYVIKAHNAGIEPYSIAIESIRKYGAEAWFSVRMNEFHYMHIPEAASSFMSEHPEYRINGNGVFDFRFAEVREYYKKYIFELCENYDIDGIEFDMIRGDVYFADDISLEEKKSILNQYLEELKHGIDEISLRKKHKIQISARVLSDIKENFERAFDLDTWFHNGFFDRITVCNFHAPLDYGIEIEKWREIIGDIPIMAGTDYAVSCFDGNNPLCRALKVDDDYLRGFSNVSLERGADGIYIFNHFIMKYNIDMKALDPETGKKRMLFPYHKPGKNRFSMPFILNEENKSTEIEIFVGTHKKAEIIVGFCGDTAPKVKVNGITVDGLITDSKTYNMNPKNIVVDNLDAVAPRWLKAEINELTGYVNIEFSVDSGDASIVWLELCSE